MGNPNTSHIDWKNEYVEARRLMSKKNVNFDSLEKSVTYAYLHCGDDMELSFLALISEIGMRRQLTEAINREV